MKKRRTNTLDSWIDQAEMQRLTNALVPEDEERDTGHQGALDEVSSIGLPVQGVDLDQPEAYQAAAFPAPQSSLEATGGQVLSGSQSVEEENEEEGVDEEGPVLRAARALAEVRLRADESGFLKRRGKKSAEPDAVVTPIPPVLDSGASANSAEPEKPALEEMPDAASSVFSIPQGPLRARLDAYADWALNLAQASRIVIVDGQGYPLVHKDLSADAGEGDAAMVDSAMRMTSVLEQVQARTDFARDGAMNLPLEEGGWLGVLRCENAGGRLCIAVVTPVPLEIEKSSLMKNDLARTMAAGGGD